MYTLQSSDDYTKLLNDRKLKQNFKDLHEMTRCINRVQEYMRIVSTL